MEDDNGTVTLPQWVLARALRKARYVYEDSVERHHGEQPEPGECWAEFEMLADYAELDGCLR
jgi:hypothetical protein